MAYNVIINLVTVFKSFLIKDLDHKIRIKWIVLRFVRLAYVGKPKQSIYSFPNSALYYFLPDECFNKPFQRSVFYFILNMLSLVSGK